eukprot:TRINITY_DN18890_c0_g1_i1.p1 TRINITY_DN18890_c0_g1~~TRINITY_DN18890_c0_g1_i1.p1  ORF type:complete len:261 (+),score=76.93 TRINITY_DN18890_c0_g1_i1:65-847(+)
MTRAAQLAALLAAASAPAAGTSWDEWESEQAASGVAPRFSEWLREEMGPMWAEATQHEFTVLLGRGQLSEAVMRRYLIQDHRFLNSFIALLASAVARIPDLQDKLPGARFLGLIASEENTYFDRSLAALGAGSAEWRAQVPDAGATHRFRDLMVRATESASLVQKLSVLVVCEWVYLEWGQREAAAQKADLPFWASEWIGLHSGPHFAGVVEYLRGLLDRFGPSETGAALATFRDTVSAEAAFWDMAMHDTHLDLPPEEL